MSDPLPPGFIPDEAPPGFIPDTSGPAPSRVTSPPSAPGQQEPDREADLSLGDLVRGVPNRPRVGKMESLGRGALEGAGFSLGGEMAALGGMIAGGAPRKVGRGFDAPVESSGQAAARRAEESMGAFDEQQDNAREDHPYLFTTGQVGGALLTSGGGGGSLARGVGTAAVGGALAGYGAGEGTAGERMQSAAEGGVVSVGADLALRGAGRGFRGAGQRLQRFAQNRRLAQAGIPDKVADEFPGGREALVESLRRNKIVGGLKSRQSVANSARGFTDKANAEREALLPANAPQVSGRKLADRWRAEAEKVGGADLARAAREAPGKARAKRVAEAQREVDELLEQQRALGLDRDFPKYADAGKGLKAPKSPTPDATPSTVPDVTPSTVPDATPSTVPDVPEARTGVGFKRPARPSPPTAEAEVMPAQPRQVELVDEAAKTRVFQGAQQASPGQLAAAERLFERAPTKVWKRPLTDAESAATAPGSAIPVDISEPLELPRSPASVMGGRGNARRMRKQIEHAQGRLQKLQDRPVIAPDIPEPHTGRAERRYVDREARSYENRNIPLRALNERRKDWGQRARPAPGADSPVHRANKVLHAGANDELEAAIDASAGPGAGARWRQLGRDEAAAISAEDGAQAAMNRADARPASWRQFAVGGGGAAVGGPVGGVAALAADAIFKGREHALGALGAEGALGFARSRLGRFLRKAGPGAAGRLAAYANMPPEEAAKEHFLQSETNPDYSKDLY